MRDLSLILCYYEHMIKICFVGHKQILANIRDKLKKAVINQIENGCRKFTMGTHGGFDRMALVFVKN